MDRLEACVRLVELCTNNGPKFEAVVDMKQRFDELWEIVSEAAQEPPAKKVVAPK